MTEHTFKLPDIGEGIAEAELATWLVKVGDIVREDDAICEVSTDKATVEIPAAVCGKVVWLGGKEGEILAIGSDLVRIDTDESVVPSEEPETPEGDQDTPSEKLEKTPEPMPASSPESPKARTAVAASTVPLTLPTGATGKPLAAPSVRGRAADLGVDLRQLRGTGPVGRILHAR